MLNTYPSPRTESWKLKYSNCDIFAKNNLNKQIAEFGLFTPAAYTELLFETKLYLS